MSGLFPEALMFLIVNRTARGIKADLTDELIYRTIKDELSDDLKSVLALTIKKSIGDFTFEIAKKMNEMKESYWFNKIIMPNEGHSDTKTVNQKVFANSVAAAIRSCGALKRTMNTGDIDSAV